MEMMSLTEIGKVGLRPGGRGSPYPAPGQGRGRWLPLGERHLKDQMSVEEQGQEGDPNGRCWQEVGTKEKFL